MIGITKLAKLPLEYSKGTDFEKIELAKKLNAELFEKISKKFRSDEISFDTFKKAVKETLPGKSSVKIMKTEERGVYGYTSFDSKHNVNITGFMIHLPESKNGKISLDTVGTFMHETFHYFSQMAAPKETRRIAKALETGYKNKFDMVYDMFLYTDFNFGMTNLSKTLDNFLSSLNTEQKIDFLQYCRYNLRNEANAFSEGEKYARLSRDLFKDKDSIRIFDSTAYNFDIKIKLLNKKLKQVMKDNRNKIFID